MKKKSYLLLPVHIEQLSRKGFGVGFIRKTETSPPVKTVVPKALPGEEVIAEIGPKKQGAYIGTLKEVTKTSRLRVPFRCVHAPVCGGCSLQQMGYEHQITHKERVVRELFNFVPESVFFPAVPCKDPWRYRNKMEYSFSQDKEKRKFLGLMRTEGRGRVETITECRLCPNTFNEILEKVRNWWESSAATAYHPFSDTGSLRTLTIREGKRTQDKMVILTVSGRPEFALSRESLNDFVAALTKDIPCASLEKFSIFLRIQQAIAGSPTEFYEMRLFGPDHIQEELEISVGEYTKKYRFKISPTAFFQPNTEQAENIYSSALGLAGLKQRNWILDLYAGTATLGMIFAPFAKRVLSVEINPYAVFDAQANREMNGVQNLQIEQGDVAGVLAKVQKQDPSVFGPDLVLLDPPRTGLGSEALKIVAELRPKEILYISCQPESQVEDCKKLLELGYRIGAIKPVDQFPHTVHVENIVLLQI